MSQPADGKFTFDQIATPGWIQEQLDFARETEQEQGRLGRKANGPDIAEKLLPLLRDWAIRTEQRRDESGWRGAWISLYQQKRPKDAYKSAKGAPGI